MADKERTWEEVMDDILKLNIPPAKAYRILSTWKERRYVKLPVAEGTMVWLVRRCYTPVEADPGWKKQWIVEPTLYSIDLRNNSDVYFNEEEAETEMERRNLLER